jgi:hypothetical protein
MLFTVRTITETRLPDVDEDPSVDDSLIEPIIEPIIEKFTFRELVDNLKSESIEASCYPVQSGDHFWISTIYSEPDYRTGEVTQTSWHLENPTPRALRYWFKAYQTAKR